MTTNFVAPVTSYRRRSFDLGVDLQRLDAVRDRSAPEAAILYGSRILDVLAGAALEKVGLKPGPDLYGNLVVLEQFNLLPLATRYWAHALRRLGNDARHSRRPIAEPEEPVALVFLERWLLWFFRHYRFGPELTELTAGAAAPWPADAALRALVEALEAPDLDGPAVRTCATAAAWQAALWHSPAVPAAVVEMLLERKERTAAAAVLKAMPKSFRGDLRLRQLQGLLWSRTGKLEQARDCLEELAGWCSYDQETAGIRGGVYKRLWDRDKNDDSLRQSFDAYHGGWVESKIANAYLGVNAASTALWLGRAADSVGLAEEVRALVQKRVSALAHHPESRRPPLSFWDQVILAEAELLLKDVPAAQAAYALAFTRYPGLHDNIAVARDQALKLLPPLGLDGLEGSFFPSG